MAVHRKLTSKIYEIKAHTGKVTSLDLGVTGRVLVTGGSDRNVNLWAIGEEKCFMSLPGHNGTIDCVRFAYNDDFVYSADDIGIIRRWDLNAQSMCSTLNGHMKSVRTLDFNPSGEYVVSGSNDTTVRLWDVRNQNRCIKTYRGHIANVNSVKFSPDGLWIASAGTEGSIIVWDIRKSKQIVQLNEIGASPVTCIQYHPNEFLLAAGRNDGSVYIYDLETNQLISKNESPHPFTGQTVKCITFSENGECLFVGTAGGISVIGWEPNREFDIIESAWSFLGDIKIVNKKMICGSFERENVTVHALSIDRVMPFYSPSETDIKQTNQNNFNYNMTARKSFSRGNHKLRLSIGSSSSPTTLANTKPNKVVEEEYEETPSPSLDCGGSNGGNSSPNLSIELVDDIDDPITQQNESEFQAFVQAKKMNTFNFPSLSSTSSRSSGPEERSSGGNGGNGSGSGGGGGGMGPSSLKSRGERDFLKLDFISSLHDDNALDMTMILNNFEEAEMEDFPVNTPLMPDYAPRFDSYLSTSSAVSTAATHHNINHQHSYNNHHYNNYPSTNNRQMNNYNNKPVIAAKPKMMTSGTATTIIPLRKTVNSGVGGIPIKSITTSNTDRTYQRKLSGLQSVSTMELHKIDDSISLSKKSTMPSRYRRDLVTATYSNHNQLNKENNTKNNRRSAQVQIITKPPSRSKTSFDLRATTPLPNNQIQSIPQKISSYTTDDSSEIHMLTTSHNQIFSELSNRYATLQLIRNSTRAQDIVGALKQAIKISGRSVFVDLLGAILEKTSTWNLDMCLLLLPEIFELLQSQHKFHHTRACDTLRVILKNFLPIIQDNIDPWSAANSLGVDITREERHRKCIECQQWLLRVRSLPADNQHVGSTLAHLQNLITF